MDEALKGHICTLMRECLERRFPLYGKNHRVDVADVGDQIWVGYRTTDANIPFGTTHVDLNILVRHLP